MKQLFHDTWYTEHKLRCHTSVHKLIIQTRELKRLCCVYMYGYNHTGTGLLGTGQYLQILDSIVIVGYFFIDTQYDTKLPTRQRQRSALSTCLLNTTIVIIQEFWDFTWYSAVYISLHINTLLCYTLLSILVLVSLEANIIGYWVPCLVSF